MKEQSYYSPRASLALIAQRFREMGLWAMVEERVKINQKKVRYAPMDKLLDGLMMILAGGRGLVEVNTRVRQDTGLQRAFGRHECADQSTISKTLNACDEETVGQMRDAIKRMIQTHGQVMQRSKEDWLVLDIDMLGMVAGRKGEGVTKGYFSGGRDKRGRQLGRVLATNTDEILVERLYTGKRQLEKSVPELIAAAEDTLKLDVTQTQENKPCGVCRLDGGGGTQANINHLFGRNYHVLTKLHNWNRAVHLAASVHHWQPDPKSPKREVGWVTLPHLFSRTTRQLAIRTVSKKGKVHYDVLVTSLSDHELTACFQLDPRIALPDTPWPFLYAYDLRGGGLETQNRCDRQGLALGHRNKRSFAAQEMLVLLGQLAHLFLVWIRFDLARTSQRLAAFGLKRIVRDILTIDGPVIFDDHHRFLRVELNPKHPLALVVSSTFLHRYVQNVA
jgi:Transposase DDE domain group 1